MALYKQARKPAAINNRYAKNTNISTPISLILSPPPSTYIPTQFPSATDEGVLHKGREQSTANARTRGNNRNYGTIRLEECWNLRFDLQTINLYFTIVIAKYAYFCVHTSTISVSYSIGRISTCCPFPPTRDPNNNFDHSRYVVFATEIPEISNWRNSTTRVPAAKPTFIPVFSETARKRTARVVRIHILHLLARMKTEAGSVGNRFVLHVSFEFAPGHCFALSNNLSSTRAHTRFPYRFGVIFHSSVTRPTVADGVISSKAVPVT